MDVIAKSTHSPVLFSSMTYWSWHLIMFGCFFCTSYDDNPLLSEHMNPMSLSPLYSELSNETSGNLSWSKHGLRANIFDCLNSSILRGFVLVHNKWTTEEEWIRRNLQFVEVFFLWQALWVWMKLTLAFYGFVVCPISLMCWQHWSKQCINIYPRRI